jgi:hypothetical protein
MVTDRLVRKYDRGMSARGYRYPLFKAAMPASSEQAPIPAKPIARFENVAALPREDVLTREAGRTHRRSSDKPVRGDVETTIVMRLTQKHFRVRLPL